MTKMKYLLPTTTTAAVPIESSRRPYTKVIDTATFLLFFLSFLSYLATVLRYARNVSAPPFEPIAANPNRSTASLPQLIIFRQTTRAPRMIMKIVSFFESHRYKTVGVSGVETGTEVDALTRNEFIRPFPRHLFTTGGHVTKTYHPERNTLTIALFSHGANENCSMSIKNAWLATKNEDDDSYIDLPLSPRHPAISTTAFRTLFPSRRDALFKFQQEMVICDNFSSTEIRKRDYYTEVKGRSTLMERLLVITGYPFVANRSHTGAPISLMEMLDAAEELERIKIGWSANNTDETGGINIHEETPVIARQWTIGTDGALGINQVEVDT